jgi:hypothetical protein
VVEGNRLRDMRDTLRHPLWAVRWCGPVKTVCCETAKINKDNDEPLLASLVRKATGEIGDGYATAVQLRYGITLDPTEIQAHADAEARKCWKYFGRRYW